MIPQGTYVERARAAGAGIAAFYTPTGVGTVVAEGKEVRRFGEREYLLERALHADFALIRCRSADRFGNARFWRTARNFSPILATAATTTILEADALLDLGEIDPDDVHLPGIFVQRIVEVTEHEGPVRVPNRARATAGRAVSWTKAQMAERAAREIEAGDIVNLGIGLPTLIADYLPEDGSVWFHSENGLLGMGPFPYAGDEDSQLINAGKQTVTVVPGGSIFDSATSFTMIRGGHVDLAVLGAMQVAQKWRPRELVDPGR